MIGINDRFSMLYPNMLGPNGTFFLPFQDIMGWRCSAPTSYWILKIFFEVPVGSTPEIMDVDVSSGASGEAVAAARWPSGSKRPGWTGDLVGDCMGFITGFFMGFFMGFHRISRDLVWDFVWDFVWGLFHGISWCVFHGTFHQEEWW